MGKETNAVTTPTDSQGFGQSLPYVGHRHFWQQALARRQFMRAGAGATALAMGSGLGLALPASAAPIGAVAPKPIPGGILLGQLVGFPNDPTISHVYFPTRGAISSTLVSRR